MSAHTHLESVHAIFHTIDTAGQGSVLLSCQNNINIYRGAHNWYAGTHARQTSEMRTVTCLTNRICVPADLRSISRRRFDHWTTEPVAVRTDGAAVNVGVYNGIVPQLLARVPRECSTSAHPHPSRRRSIPHPQPHPARRGSIPHPQPHTPCRRSRNRGAEHITLRTEHCLLVLIWVTH